MTTNLAFKEWNTVFPNASCATALVVHHADVVKIAGKSYRLRDAELDAARRDARNEKAKPGTDDPA